MKQNSPHIHIPEKSTRRTAGALFLLPTGEYAHSLSKEPHNTENARHTARKMTRKDTVALTLTPLLGFEIRAVKGA